MSFRSTLYTGSVMHRRLRPHAHRLRYRVFWMLLDLDEIDTLAKNLRFFSHNRFNAASFHDHDHGDGSDTPLREQVLGHLRNANIDLDGGSINLLCMPRIFGYGFNPISIYFCHRRDHSLAAILYEVHNTFGQRHSYLIPAETSADGVIEQHCDKNFYVSPFIDMDMRYAFRIGIPDERVTLTIHGSDKNGLMIVAALAGDRRELANLSLLRALIAFPFLTLKVIAAIHWHALRMLVKGYRLRARPPAPAQPVTTIRLNG
jgi:DUF1365 family protein